MSAHEKAKTAADPAIKSGTAKSGNSMTEQRRDNSEQSAKELPEHREQDQGIRKDQRGQEQPVDKSRAQHNK